LPHFHIFTLLFHFQIFKLSHYFKIIVSFSCVLFSLAGYSQTKFSLATDLAAVRSFDKGQRFTAIGQTISAHFHFTSKEGAYVWYSYSAPGKFKNDFLAVAKSPAIMPQTLDFKSYSQISFRSISVGWKHYLRGSAVAEESWNLYFTAGFGLAGGRVKNIYTINSDTANYNFPANPVEGTGKFRRLTFDVGLGYEIPIGMAIYLFGEGRVRIPASDYPSKYLLVNDNAPVIGTVNIGLRVLFD